jgi:hypothetical protein
LDGAYRLHRFLGPEFENEDEEEEEVKKVKVTEGLGEILAMFAEVRHNRSLAAEEEGEVKLEGGYGGENSDEVDDESDEDYDEQEEDDLSEDEEEDLDDDDLALMHWNKELELEQIEVDRGMADEKAGINVGDDLTEDFREMGMVCRR